MDSTTSKKKVNLCEICEAPAKKRCTCGTAYCSIECQKMIWYTHKMIHDHDLPFIRQPDFYVQEIQIMTFFGMLGKPYNAKLFKENLGYFTEPSSVTLSTLEKINTGSNKQNPLDRNYSYAVARLNILEQTFQLDVDNLIEAFELLELQNLIPFYRILHPQENYHYRDGIFLDHSYQLINLEFIFNSVVFNPNLAKSDASNLMLKKLADRLYILNIVLAGDKSNLEYYTPFVHGFRISNFAKRWETNYFVETGKMTAEEGVISINKLKKWSISQAGWLNNTVFY